MAHRRTEHYIILYYIILYYIALNPFFLFTSYCNYCNKLQCNCCFKHRCWGGGGGGGSNHLFGAISQKGGRTPLKLPRETAHASILTSDLKLR